MGNRDVAEQLEAAIEEVGKLEREVATLRAEKDSPHADAKYWGVWRASAAYAAKLSIEVVALTATIEQLRKRPPIVFADDHEVCETDLVAAFAWIEQVRGHIGQENTDSWHATKLRRVRELLALVPGDALAEHDRAVKAEALEDAAIDIVLTPVADWKRHGNRGIRENAEADASAWMDARATEIREAT